jgi:hypothetical protein
VDENFTFTIAKGSEAPKSVTEYFNTEDVKLEKWNFTWYEGTLQLRRSLWLQ